MEVEMDDDLKSTSTLSFESNSAGDSSGLESPDDEMEIVSDSGLDDDEGDEDDEVERKVSRKEKAVQLLTEKAKVAGWALPASQTVNRWVNLLVSQLGQSNDPGLDADDETTDFAFTYRLHTAVHYCSLEDVARVRVRMGAEKQLVRQQYTRATFPPRTRQRLQLPATTIGVAVLTDPCPKCGATKTFTRPTQPRSIDEPTDFERQCPRCDHRWRER